MDVNSTINQFATFINNCYEELIDLSHSIEINNMNFDLADKIENGFYQFIWEIMVETQLCFGENSLEPYGDGADFYGKSSRVVYPEKFATNKIIVNVIDEYDFFAKKKITIQNLDFVKLVTFNGYEYSVKKPFDFVLCEDCLGNQFLFSLNKVDFLLAKIEEDN